ncbi:MAG: AtpZ/AtpI family protein [Bacteroidales bacterium]
MKTVEQQQPDPERKESKGREGLDAYSRYSTIAIQMVIIIIIMSLGGVKLDQLAGTEPLLTVIFSLLGVVAAMWLVIKEALKQK